MPDPDPATADSYGGVLLMLLLLALNMLLRFSQTAVIALNDAKLAKAAEDGDKRAKRVLKLTAHPTAFTEAVRLCSLLLGFGAMSGAIYAFSSPLGEALSAAGLPQTACMPISLLLLVLASTAVWLLLCELLPQRIAPLKSEAIAYATVDFLRAITVLLRPLQALLSCLADLLTRLFGVDPHAAEEQITEEEIRMLVDVGEETGVIEGSQKEMINNIFEFDDITAQDIMTPRTDMEAIDVSDSVDDALYAAVDNGVSRLPVYEEDIDHIVGVLYIKDLLPYVGRQLPSVVTVRSMMREPLFVPETKRCGELFSEMTALHIQMAMVVDEYGGIAGIVTMEDLLESIVGNMQDEYDNEQEEVRCLDENTFEVDGSMAIEQVTELLDTALPEGEYDTLGGFLLAQLGRIPDPEEHPQITYENIQFTVREMDDRRIELVHIERKPPQADADGDK